MIIYLDNEYNVKAVSEKDILVGDYIKIIYNGDIPRGNIQNYKFIDGKFVLNIEKYFNDLKTFLLSQNNQEFNNRINQLTLSYPEREILTWDKQEQEARAYIADNTTSTPLLDSLAASRGIDKDTLARKIVEKADAYASEVGSFLGKRQRIEDLINSKTTIEELEQIDVKGLWDEQNI